MEGIGTNEDNIAFFTIKIVIINMELRLAIMDIDELHIGMPMKENVRLTIFHHCSGEGVGSQVILIGDIFVEFT